jgi:hypothetical protein
MWKIVPKDKQTQKQAYTNAYVEHISDSGTTLWNLGKERKEKRMTEHQ